ncbi:MAG: DNA polymerase III subunit delta [Lachnospiraceae bacterium]|nr:DNA polymerase III subunit delta [Candidatus Merdinaster equi]
MKQIDNDIQNGTIKNIYLLYGQERYLIMQYKDKIVKALVSDGDTMNFSKFEGSEVTLPQLVDLSETMPFLSEKRVIWVNNCGLFKKGGEELSEYIPQIPDTTVLIFTELEADKRSKAVKAADKRGRVVEFNTPDESTIRTWIKSRFKSEGKDISGDTITHFLKVTGADMGSMSTEIEKLICYALDRNVIVAEDIDEVCTHQITGKVFDMVEAVARGQQDKALSLYTDLLALREPPLRILALISRQFNILLQVKEMKQVHASDKDIAAKVGIPPFTVSRYADQASRFSRHQLMNALEECAATDEKFKSGMIEDVIGVELLIIKYSGRK